ncbi:MAG: recombinase family protein [Planctomycetaceae bacterium]|nr:recombinase family protein [Planctomycetaceae bacterium]
MKIARIYQRVSTVDQDLARQEQIVDDARRAGFYIAGVYSEKASGANADRAELNRMIRDLQPGEVVIAEKMDRISRLALPEAERLVKSIRDKGARLAIPGVVDFTEIMNDSDGVAKIILESVQEMLLKLALQMARDDYETRRERQRQGIALAKASGKYAGRKANTIIHQRIIALRKDGHTITETAKAAGCSVSQVKRIMAMNRQKNHHLPSRQ